jgi:hypothetical protein
MFTMSNVVRFRDIDQLLVNLGFERRPDPRFIACVLPTDSRRLFMFPLLANDEPADGSPLADVRHHLIWWGFLDEDAFDRWLCAVKFGEGCREPAAAGATDGRAAH